MTDELITDEELTEEPTPTPLTISEKVKLALRISHNLLDSEISDVITSARLELKRAGVNTEKAESDNEDVVTAIKTYALAYFSSDNKDSERYSESFNYQCDCLRKSYGVENV